CVVPEGLMQSRKEEERTQIQHHLNQISMQMNMEDEPAPYIIPAGDGAAVGMQQSVLAELDFLPSHHTGGCSFPSSSSTSSSFRSASLSCSPENSSAHALATPAAGLQFPEVSSHVPPLVLPCDDDYHQYVLNFHDTAAMEPAVVPASAFSRYARHLGARRRPKPACGQKMFKKSMSVLVKMQTAVRYSHQQHHFQQASAVAELSSVNQLQHMISERKRREKLNDSFQALKTVLPPGSKKDKTSILITAREYVKSLKSKVCDLEEKNKALQAQLAECARAAGRVEEDDAEKVEIQITRAAADREDGTTTSEVCTVKIAARPAHGNTMDVVLRTLQCLNDQMGEEDVSLVAMSTSYGDGVNGLTGAFLTMQLKSASGAKWEEEVVREAVAKAVAARTGADRRGDAAGRSRHAE
ncbi:putative transcription factor bHLH041, partial [Triticum dicoccoides]|uniref:putative transcription factor bHLH041 n=1 Tax=Triticum dicoccoides TaxID=85692 RepID=UPI00188F2A7E